MYSACPLKCARCLAGRLFVAHQHCRCHRVLAVNQHCLRHVLLTSPSGIPSRAGYFLLDKASGMWSLEMGGTNCAIHYLKGWAIIDILSVVPFDLLLLLQSGLSSRLQLALVRLPRCLKLLRLPRLFRCASSTPLRHHHAANHTCRMCICSALAAAPAPSFALCVRAKVDVREQRCRYIKKWQELIPVSSIMMQLSTCVCVMLLFAHIAACFLVIASQLEGLPPECWLVYYGARCHVSLWRDTASCCLVICHSALASADEADSSRLCASVAV